MEGADARTGRPQMSLRRLLSWLAEKAAELRIPRALVYIVVLGLLIRLAFVFYLKLYADDYSHQDIGVIPLNLFHGHGYTYDGRPSAYFGPGYSLLWAGMMFLFGVTGGQLAVQILQVVALSLLPLIWYVVASELFGNRMVALVSAFWLAVYPELLLLSGTMYSDSIVLFLWVLFLALIVRWRQTSSTLLGILVGLTMASLILTKGRMLAFAGVALLYFFARDWQSLKQGARPRYLVPLACAIAVMSVWTARNMVQLHAFVPTESTVGYNLWIGHNEHANGTGKYRLGSSGLVQLRGLGLNDQGASADRDFPKSPSLRSKLDAAGTEPAIDAVYRMEASSFIKHHASREASLALKKVAYGWWRDPKSILTRNPGYILPWLATLLLAGVGLIKTFGAARRYVLIYLVCIVATALHIVFFVVPRFRLPIYPFVFTLAALGTVELLELAAARNARCRKAYGALSTRLLRT